jgi:DNA-binding NtrC family response regulator
MAKILVLEDEILIAMLLRDWLAEMGFDPVGPVASIRDALELIDRGDLDAAILDVRLADGDSYVAAEALQAKSIPFAFASGHATAGIDPRFPAAPVLSKPFEFDDVQGLLEGLLTK